MGEVLRVYSGGPWTIGGRPIKLMLWKDNFQPKGYHLRTGYVLRGFPGSSMIIVCLWISETASARLSQLISSL